MAKVPEMRSSGRRSPPDAPIRSRKARTHRLLRASQIAGVVLFVGAWGSTLLIGRALGSNPTVTIPPGPFASGQAITVAGSGFPPRGQDPTGLQIIQCSDPQGLRSNLPSDASGCEGITGNVAQISPDAGGKFRTQYQVIALSSQGAGSNSSIDCDATHQCVLWVGEDYNNAFMSGPHAFSAPFAVTPGSPAATPTMVTPSRGSTPGGVGAPTGAPSGSSPGSRTGTSGRAGAPSSPASAGPGGGTLAYTGVPGILPWIVALGAVMVITGTLGRWLSTARI